jgi:glucose-6-phosphate 1-dehydrogenase
MDRVHYFRADFDDDARFEGLRSYLAAMDEKFGTKGNRLFYLAVAPEFFADIIARLGMRQSVLGNRQRNSESLCLSPSPRSLAEV